MSTPLEICDRNSRYVRNYVKLPILVRRTWPNRPVRQRRTMLSASVRRLKTHWQTSNGVNSLYCLVMINFWLDF